MHAVYFNAVTKNFVFGNNLNVYVILMLMTAIAMNWYMSVDSYDLLEHEFMLNL